jgi:hypothetical protein
MMQLKSNLKNRRPWSIGTSLLSCAAMLLILNACADANVPGARNANVPNPTMADDRQQAINEQPDAILHLPLGEDVLVPQIGNNDPLPNDIVGPFELRGETVAGALQLILADYDISLAFETDEGLTRRITVANLRGPLSTVVRQVCSLANLYCSYDEGLLIVKDTQTFTVKIPPISQDPSYITNIAQGLAAIVGGTPIVDQSTRSIIYEASQRTADLAMRYFQRMRSSTALIVFETYIWEVQLNTGNSTGIRWDHLQEFGKYKFSINMQGDVGANFTNPISIGLPTTQATISANDVFKFLSQYGAVKTISQPQITVLSGSTARLRAADTENYVAQVAETIDNGQSTTSVSTSTVDTGFTLTIGSAWDNATVYADIEINLSDVAAIDDFSFSNSGTGASSMVQLPKTTERELATQVRIRPGDSLLIGGLVRESDNFSSSGPGFSMRPFFPMSRSIESGNLELVFLLRPRVIVYTSPDEAKYFVESRDKKHREEKMAREAVSDSSIFASNHDDQMGAPLVPTYSAPDDVTMAPVTDGPILSTEPTSDQFTAEVLSRFEPVYKEPEVLEVVTEKVTVTESDAVKVTPLPLPILDAPVKPLPPVQGHADTVPTVEVFTLEESIVGERTMNDPVSILPPGNASKR